MPPRLRPNHNPQLRDALPPASLDQFDGRAIEAISRQKRDLEEHVGRVDRAVIPGEDNEPLYGYHVELDSGTEIKLEIETDAAGEPIPEDQEFVEARNRMAILRSRERSRGSRMFNFAFRKNRGGGPGGHGYNTDDAHGLEGIQEQYDEQLSNFISRKIHANSRITSRAHAEQAASRAIIQEQKQMSALERMSAELKSRNPVMNFFRNHKWARTATGLALSGVSVVGMATGQLEIAIPALAARSALSATGGYLLGRTGWDAFQGWRTRRLPHDDIRMAGHNNGDFSGPLEPEAAFERFVKINGAEARAGSGNPRRQELRRELGRLVHEHYVDQFTFTGTAKPSRNTLRDQVQGLYDGIINPLEEERLTSDQTQSRRRHIAGLVGGTIMAALPLTRAITLINIGGGGGGHEVASHATHHGTHSSHSHVKGPHTDKPETSQPSHVTKPDTTASNHVQPGNPNTTAGTQVTEHASGIVINTGSGHDTITIGMPSENTAHAHGLQGSHSHHPNHGHHQNRHGIQTRVSNELHVASGGGFISTLEDQYHLDPHQADATYHAMYGHLRGASGTYMDGSDIRISAPGDFHLNHGAHTDLERELRHFHKTPGNHHGTDIHAAVDLPTGGLTAPEHLGHHANLADHDGGTTAPESTTDPHNPKVTVVHGKDGQEHIYIPPQLLEGGNGHDASKVLIDGVYTPDTGLHGVTPEQASQAQAYLTSYVHGDGFHHMSPQAQMAAETAVNDYVKASLERPVSGTYAHQAMHRLDELWKLVGHHFHNVSATDAEKLEENLAIVNAG